MASRCVRIRIDCVMAWWPNIMVMMGCRFVRCGMKKWARAENRIRTPSIPNRPGEPVLVPIRILVSYTMSSGSKLSHRNNLLNAETIDFVHYHQPILILYLLIAGDGDGWPWQKLMSQPGLQLRDQANAIIYSKHAWPFSFCFSKSMVLHSCLQVQGGKYHVNQ